MECFLCDQDAEIIDQTIDLLGYRTCIFCRRKAFKDMGIPISNPFLHPVSDITDVEMEHLMSQAERPTRGRPKGATDSNEVKSGLIWEVTVNAVSNIDPIAFWKRMTKMMNSYKADYKLYALEQRSADPDEPMGWHIHVMLEHPKPVFKSQLIQKFYNAFADFIGSAQSVDVRPVNPNTQKYIKGDKTKHKMDKVAVDRIFKEKNNIPLYVENGSPIS